VIHSLTLAATYVTSQFMKDENTVSFRKRYKNFRKTVLSFMPFVRRSRHERIIGRTERYLHRRYQEEHAKNEALSALFFSPAPLAPTAKCRLRVEMNDGVVDELALFVTHATSKTLKPHVIDHVNALIDEGIAVVLIANSDANLHAPDIGPDLAARLHGCLIRENIGYDFAAWAHAYALIEPDCIRQRLYMINDSIIGPLDRGAYRILLQRIRSSQAHIVGLTSNPDPHDHLQSFYLTVQGQLLHSEVFEAFMRSIVNMPSKQLVIDCYEIWLSPFMKRKGFRSAAIFPNLTTEQQSDRNDTVHRWAQLIEVGFPFIKSMVLKDPVQAEAARRFLPPHYF
jgi:hypothetical protein